MDSHTLRFSIIFKRFVLQYVCYCSGTNSASQSKSETEGKTKLSMKTTLYDYDRSVYGFQEFFKLHGILRDDESAQTPAAHVNTEK